MLRRWGLAVLVAMDLAMRTARVVVLSAQLCRMAAWIPTQEAWVAAHTGPSPPAFLITE